MKESEYKIKLQIAELLEKIAQDGIVIKNIRAKWGADMFKRSPTIDDIELVIFE